MKKVCVISLGCPKNTVDSEKIIGVAGDSNYAISPVPDDSDFVIVNTCAFIKPAVLEAKRMISRLKKLKEKRNFKLIVAGCLVARNFETLFNDIDIDGIIGPYDIDRLSNVLSEIESGKRVLMNQSAKIKNYCTIPRIVSTWPYAYLKITEGCSNRCSYCTIPLIRGELFSYSEKEILKEAEFLFNSGIKELIIVGHDITAYGKDTHKSNLCKIVRGIIKIGFPWIRLMYLHPAGITDDLLDLIKNSPQICKYLDVPVQHSCPEILKNMNRPVIDYRKFFERIRKSVPGIALRSTVIVGFPGETDKIFKHLVDFVTDVRFEKLGIFTYYREKNTPASMMKWQVPEEIKKERFVLLREIQKKISKEIASSFTGQILDVLIEGRKNGICVGRTQRDAPDIDWSVKIKGKCEPGEIVKVAITKSFYYSLEGIIV